MEITRTALVLHPAMDMFRLVKDVESYPRFLKWCTDAVLHEHGAEQLLATLTVKVGGVTQSFTTRNRFVPGEWMTLSLVDGPFRRLAGDWRFEPLGDEGCKITLTLEFDFSSRALSSTFRRGFAYIADHMVGEFCKRADAVYGL